MTMENELKKVYTNSARVSSSLFDLQISFFYKSISEAVKLSKDGAGYDGEFLMEVSMSLQHAKVLVAILQNHIRDFEKEFGNIPLSPINEHSADEHSNEQ